MILLFLLLPRTAFGEEPPTLRIQGRVVQPLKIAVLPFPPFPLSSGEMGSFSARLEEDLLYHGALTTIAIPAPQSLTFGTQDFRFLKAVGADLALLYQMARQEGGIHLAYRLLDAVAEKVLSSRTVVASGSTTPEILADLLASRVIGELLRITPPFGRRIFFQVRDPTSRWRILGLTDFLGTSYKAYFSQQRLVLSPFPLNSEEGVLIGNSGSSPEIFLFRLTPSPLLKPLYRSEGNLFQVTFRPGSSPPEFIFSEERSGNVDLYLLSGGKAIRITTHPQADYSPTFSPDGKRVAFVSERTGLPSLWVVDLETRVESPLYLGEGMVSAPDWSPDGQWLTFIEARGNRFLLQVLPYGSSTPVSLWEDTAPLEHPSFAVDNRTIAFSRLDGARYALYRIDRLIPHPRKLLSIPGDARLPVWER
jgi:TolB protein